ncbi:PEP-CTERM sorting domain-containing protein [Tunturiibacter gelidiferens]|uniref:PEP-CTERM sorting domain-containing protein n=1 Tax=Tunturiibacter gelidiferens TaxID=3069689 RepID=UPI003D9B5DA1
MRLPLALAIASVLGSSVPSHADSLVTIIVSIVGSGSIGNETFTYKRITLADTTTLESYYENGDFQGPGWSTDFGLSSFSSLYGAIQGIGTFGTEAFIVSDQGLYDPYGRLEISSGLSSPATPETIGPVFGGGAVGDACYGSSTPCPGYIETSKGNLYITSFDSNSAIGEEILTTTPEPSTLALFGTGMIGVAGFARRKFIRT